MSARVIEFQNKLRQACGPTRESNETLDELFSWKDALSVCCTIYESALESGDLQSANLVGGFVRQFCRGKAGFARIKAQTDTALPQRLFQIMTACLTTGDLGHFFSLLTCYVTLCFTYEGQSPLWVRQACNVGFALLKNPHSADVGLRIVRKFIPLMDRELYQPLQTALKQIFASGLSDELIPLLTRAFATWKRFLRNTIDDIIRDEDAFVLSSIHTVLTLPQSYHTRQEKITDPNVQKLIYNATTFLHQLVSHVSRTDETNGIIITRVCDLLGDAIFQAALVSQDTLPDGGWQGIRGILLGVVFSLMPEKINGDSTARVIGMAVSLFSLSTSDEEELINPYQWYEIVYPSLDYIPRTWRHPRNWGTVLLRTLAQDLDHFDEVFRFLLSCQPCEEVLFGFYRLKEVIGPDNAELMGSIGGYLQMVAGNIGALPPTAQLTLGLAMAQFCDVLPGEVISGAASICSDIILSCDNKAYLTAACDIVFELVSRHKWTPPENVIHAIIERSRQVISGVGIRLTSMFLESGNGDFVYNQVTSIIEELKETLKMYEDDVPRDKYDALCESLGDTFAQYPDIPVPCADLCEIFSYSQSNEIGIVLASIARGLFKNNTPNVYLCVEPWIAHIEEVRYTAWLVELGAVFCSFITFQCKNWAEDNYKGLARRLYQAVMNLVQLPELFKEDWCSLIKVLSALTQAGMLTGPDLQATLEIVRRGNGNPKESDKLSEAFVTVELLLSAFIAADVVLDEPSINWWMEFLRAGQFSTNYLRFLSLLALDRMNPKLPNAEEIFGRIMRDGLPLDDEFYSGYQFLYWNSDDDLMPIQLRDHGQDFVVGEI